MYILIQNVARGKILNVIQSMYKRIIRGVKANNNLTGEFSSHIGVRQGGCLSLFLSSKYIYGFEGQMLFKTKC